MVKVKFVYISICFLIFAFVAAYAKKQVGRETIFIDCILTLKYKRKQIFILFLKYSLNCWNCYNKIYDKLPMTN